MPTILRAQVARPLVNSDGTFKLPRLEVWFCTTKKVGKNGWLRGSQPTITGRTTHVMFLLGKDGKRKIHC